MTLPGPVLSTRDLSVSFGGLKAVDQVSIDIAPGVITSIIGPNGAGKSTLFNLISGAIRPSSGRVLLDGEDVTGAAPHRMQAKGLSRSFQITNLFSGSSVYENLRLAAQVLEPSWHGFLPVPWSARARDKVDEIITRFGLEKQATMLAGHLSHGEQRRLEIAACLASEPRVLLLDEPTQGMSHSDTKEAAELVKNIAGDLTIVLIEHDIDLVMDLSGHVIVLAQGRKLAEGPPAEVRANKDVQTAYFGAH
jgi:branched-chain amino acid transport system ATP-binding protein